MFEAQTDIQPPDARDNSLEKVLRREEKFGEEKKATEDKTVDYRWKQMEHWFEQTQEKVKDRKKLDML